MLASDASLQPVVTVLKGHNMIFFLVAQFI